MQSAGPSPLNCRRVRWSWPAINRNVAILGASIFGLALGEELWLAYVPAYLTALGASGLVVGLFGSLKDLLDSVYQYPGGWTADRFGRRFALLAFTSMAIAGYLVYAVATDWPVVFVGLLGVMCWKSGAFPTTFAVIGDAVPKGRRSVAFSVQSILVRAPRVIGAPVGGWLIWKYGMVPGIRVALGLTIALAAGVLAAQHRWYRDEHPPSAVSPDVSIRAAVASLPEPLLQLLAADCLVRIGEGIAASFIVLYVLEVRQVPAAMYGVLYAVQQSIAIASYLPGGKIADATGRAPVVALTLVFFSLFPLAVRLASGDAALVGAFIIGGLKEVGEPARKSLIVDLAPDEKRARTVGLYYAVRNALVVPAGVVGGVLWQRSPTLPLEVAFVVSLTGAAVFAFTSVRRYNPSP
jgi:MFS family permease